MGTLQVAGLRKDRCFLEMSSVIVRIGLEELG